MILDSLINWQKYFNGAKWDVVEKFISTLNENTPEGEYPIISGQIFARVMTYETKDYDESVFESHRNFIDVQVVLSGAEGFVWHDVNRLYSSVAYNHKTDVEFYVTPKTSYSRVDLRPGQFIVFFSNDAHMPQLIVDGVRSKIKKAVVKIHNNFFNEQTN